MYCLEFSVTFSSAKTTTFLNKPNFSLHNGELKMTERMIGLDSAVAVAEAPVAPAIVETKTATKRFCMEIKGDWCPVQVPASYRIQDLIAAIGAREVSEMQYDTVIDRYKHLESGPIQAHHVYTPVAYNKDKLSAFLEEHKVKH